MQKRAYGQYCGLARALELVGERWALLIVRDLLVGPRRFSDLRRGLPRIPTNVLTTRLKELEEAGLVQRRLQPRPATGVVYELTPYGAELEAVVIQLGLWGAKSLGDPRDEDIVTPDLLTIALRTTFRPEAARGLRATFELHVGPVVVNARIDDGRLEVGEGTLPSADLVIAAGPKLRLVMAGELSPDDALAAGELAITGDPALLTRFAQVFRIEPLPAASA
ncbi:MAG: transcriptional regulator [Candidatus Eremiobacteraeota bacterium]|nr:transcriptional regulator [Candidatus Eremiobacteraeota bacterium]